MQTSYNLSLGHDYIMAIEDSPVQAKMLQHFFKINGLNNKFFSNALDAFEEAIATPPVLIISDIVMPGMDGYEFCSRVKQHPVLKEIPVILLTSLRDPLDIIKGLQAGADNFITKPYEDVYLLSRIHYLLANRDLRRGGSAEMVMEIIFRGDKYTINSEKKQILDLLLSVYEAAIDRNDRLISTQAELEAANENLVVANQELESFSYTVSHDLRSPLNGIAGFAQLLLDNYGSALDEEANLFLSQIIQSAFSMSNLIEDLLRFSHSSRSEITREDVDLSALATSVLTTQAERGGKDAAKYRYTVEPGIRVFADPGLMNVALTNLLGNAWKYSGKVDRPLIGFGSRMTGSSREIFVRDNGAGFDMAKANKLFSPFQRLHTKTEFSGTGVGLATVKRIIERHGGDIWAESAPGEGATFYFTLPSA